MKFGGVGALYTNLGRVQIWELQPPGDAHPKNVAFDYDVGKISAGCLVYYTINVSVDVVFISY